MSVSMTPGATQFTVMPEGPTSLANAFVSPMIAAFVADYIGMPLPELAAITTCNAKALYGLP